MTPIEAAERFTEQRSRTPRLRVLVTDEIDAEGVALLTAVPELEVDVVPTLPAATLLERIGNYDAIVGRSATRISAELLTKATRLKVVGRAGVGVDNVDLDKATELGIAVINAPAGNTIAVAELVFGTLIGLLRQIPKASGSMEQGRWDRSKLMGRELNGRTLGIVGLGRIGSEVARRAHAFGMELIGYDPYIADERFAALRVRRVADLGDLLAIADIVTIHTPLTDETRGLVARAELERIKPGAIIANLARGGIIDDRALLDALASGRVAGAVLDVYEQEPLSADHPLRTAPNILLTPHIGASTVEAQRNVAVEVSQAVRDALLTGEFSRSLNVAELSRDEWRDLRPTMGVARRAASLARAMLADRGAREIRRISLRCGPAVINGSEVLIASAALGVLEGVVETDRLNLINARTLAEMRGLELAVRESDQMEHPSAVEICLAAGQGELAIQGVATPDAAPRLTRIGDYHVDIQPRNILIVLTNNDVPGVIGRVGTLLGEARVNIASYHQARVAQGGTALAAISVDDPVPESVRQALLALPDVLSATVATFR